MHRYIIEEGEEFIEQLSFVPIVLKCSSDDLALEFTADDLKPLVVMGLVTPEELKNLFPVEIIALDDMGLIGNRLQGRVYEIALKELKENLSSTFQTELAAQLYQQALTEQTLELTDETNVSDYIDFLMGGSFGADSGQPLIIMLYGQSLSLLDQQTDLAVGLELIAGKGVTVDLSQPTKIEDPLFAGMVDKVGSNMVGTGFVMDGSVEFLTTSYSQYLNLSQLTESEFELVRGLNMAKPWQAGIKYMIDSAMVKEGMLTFNLDLSEIILGSSELNEVTNDRSVAGVKSVDDEILTSFINAFTFLDQESLHAITAYSDYLSEKDQGDLAMYVDSTKLSISIDADLLDEQLNQELGNKIYANGGLPAAFAKVVGNLISEEDVLLLKDAINNVLDKYAHESLQARYTDESTAALLNAGLIDYYTDATSSDAPLLIDELSDLAWHVVNGMNPLDNPVIYEVMRNSFDDYTEQVLFDKLAGVGSLKYLFSPLTYTVSDESFINSISQKESLSLVGYNAVSTSINSDGLWVISDDNYSNELGVFEEFFDFSAYTVNQYKNVSGVMFPAVELDVRYAGKAITGFDDIQAGDNSYRVVNMQDDKIDRTESNLVDIGAETWSYELGEQNLQWDLPLVIESIFNMNPDVESTFTNLLLSKIDDELSAHGALSLDAGDLQNLLTQSLHERKGDLPLGAIIIAQPDASGELVRVIIPEMHSNNSSDTLMPVVSYYNEVGQLIVVNNENVLIESSGMPLAVKMVSPYAVSDSVIISNVYFEYGKKHMMYDSSESFMVIDMVLPEEEELALSVGMYELLLKNDGEGIQLGLNELSAAGANIAAQLYNTNVDNVILAEGDRQLLKLAPVSSDQLGIYYVVMDNAVNQTEIHALSYSQGDGTSLPGGLGQVMEFDVPAGMNQESILGLTSTFIDVTPWIFGEQRMDPSSSIRVEYDGEYEVRPHFYSRYGVDNLPAFDVILYDDYSSVDQEVLDIPFFYGFHDDAEFQMMSQVFINIENWTGKDQTVSVVPQVNLIDEEVSDFLYTDNFVDDGFNYTWDTFEAMKFAYALDFIHEWQNVRTVNGFLTEKLSWVDHSYAYAVTHTDRAIWNLESVGHYIYPFTMNKPGYYNVMFASDGHNFNIPWVVKISGDVSSLLADERVSEADAYGFFLALTPGPGRVGSGAFVSYEQYLEDYASYVNLNIPDVIAGLLDEYQIDIKLEKLLSYDEYTTQSDSGNIIVPGDYHDFQIEFSEEDVASSAIYLFSAMSYEVARPHVLGGIDVLVEETDFANELVYCNQPIIDGWLKAIESAGVSDEFIISHLDLYRCYDGLDNQSVVLESRAMLQEDHLLEFYPRSNSFSKNESGFVKNNTDTTSLSETVSKLSITNLLSSNNQLDILYFDDVLELKIDDVFPSQIVISAGEEVVVDLAPYADFNITSYILSQVPGELIEIGPGEKVVTASSIYSYDASLPQISITSISDGVSELVFSPQQAGGGDLFEYVRVPVLSGSISSLDNDDAFSEQAALLNAVVEYEDDTVEIVHMDEIGYEYNIARSNNVETLSSIVTNDFRLKVAHDEIYFSDWNHDGWDDAILINHVGPNNSYIVNGEYINSSAVQQYPLSDMLLMDNQKFYNPMDPSDLVSWSGVFGHLGDLTYSSADQQKMNDLWNAALSDPSAYFFSVAYGDPLPEVGRYDFCIFDDCSPYIQVLENLITLLPSSLRQSYDDFLAFLNLNPAFDSVYGEILYANIQGILNRLDYKTDVDDLAGNPFVYDSFDEMIENVGWYDFVDSIRSQWFAQRYQEIHDSEHATSSFVEEVFTYINYMLSLSAMKASFSDASKYTSLINLFSQGFLLQDGATLLDLVALYGADLSGVIDVAALTDLLRSNDQLMSQLSSVDFINTSEEDLLDIYIETLGPVGIEQSYSEVIGVDVDLATSLILSDPGAMRVFNSIDLTGSSEADLLSLYYDAFGIKEAQNMDNAFVSAKSYFLEIYFEYLDRNSIDLSNFDESHFVRFADEVINDLLVYFTTVDDFHIKYETPSDVDPFVKVDFALDKALAVQLALEQVVPMMFDSNSSGFHYVPASEFVVLDFDEKRFLEVGQAALNNEVINILATANHGIKVDYDLNFILNDDSLFEDLNILEPAAADWSNVFRSLSIYDNLIDYVSNVVQDDEVDLQLVTSMAEQFGYSLDPSLDALNPDGSGFVQEAVYDQEAYDIFEAIALELQAGDLDDISMHLDSLIGVAEIQLRSVMAQAPTQDVQIKEAEVALSETGSDIAFKTDSYHLYQAISSDDQEVLVTTMYSDQLLSDSVEKDALIQQLLS